MVINPSAVLIVTPNTLNQADWKDMKELTQGITTISIFFNSAARFAEEFAGRYASGEKRQWVSGFLDYRLEEEVSSDSKNPLRLYIRLAVRPSLK